MTLAAKLAPPNSVVLLGDPTQTGVPATMEGGLIASTDTCVAIGVLSEVDGETAFTLGPATEVDPGYPPSFEGILLTPARSIALRTVLGAVVLEATVAGEETQVKVWANGQSEPDRIAIGIA
jgi:hypothetical protein